VHTIKEPISPWPLDRDHHLGGLAPREVDAAIDGLRYALEHGAFDNNRKAVATRALQHLENEAEQWYAAQRKRWTPSHRPRGLQAATAD
jgi:hypothetical protein